MEKAAALENKDEAQTFLTTELNLLHGRILHGGWREIYVLYH